MIYFAGPIPIAGKPMTDESDDGGKYKGHFEKPPQKKGGRRGQNPNSRKGLANLKPWPKGTSGNILGQPKSVVELNKQVRDMMPGVYQRMERIVHDPNSKDRDRIAAATLLDARGCGRPAIGIFHGTTGPGMPPGHLPEGEDGGPSILILAANSRQKDANYKKQLQAELRRIEAEEADEGRAREEHLAAAAEAIDKGEDVDGVTRLLIAARARQAERAAAQAAHEAAAPPPPQSPEPEAASAPAQDAKAGVTPPSANAPPFQAGPGEAPTSAPKSPQSASARQARKTPPPPGAPAGYAEFLSAKATEERDDELAKKQEAARADPARYPGGQVPMNELKPDPRPPLEVVNFTRVPGGRGIKRA